MIGATQISTRNRLHCSYDFWYQPHHNVMISSEWGHIRCLVDGLNLDDVAAGNYGTHLNVFDWKNKKLIQRVDLGIEGITHQQ